MKTEAAISASAASPTRDPAKPALGERFLLNFFGDRVWVTVHGVDAAGVSYRGKNCCGHKLWADWLVMAETQAGKRGDGAGPRETLDSPIIIRGNA